jgi:hypothetical protein
MDVHLYQFPNVQVEASMFRHWNTDVRKPSSLDRFRAAIREGDAGALTIERIVEEAGFTLIYDGTQGRTPNAVGSVDVLYDVYTGPGGEARLSKILRLAKRTWPTKGGAASRVLIMALDAWLRRYDGRYDDARFVRVVGTHDETRDPRRLLANSTTRRDLGGVSAYNAALLALWTAYNYKLRTKRLPHPFGEPEAEAKP